MYSFSHGLTLAVQDAAVAVQDAAWVRDAARATRLSNESRHRFRVFRVKAPIRTAGLDARRLPAARASATILAG